MENVTHTLVGLLLARTGLNRWTRGATAVLILSANAPDADIVVSPWGALRYLEAHRGYSHSLVGLPVMAALAVVVTAIGLRRNIGWTRLWLLGCLGVASHLLLDWTNSYGIRLLLPFSSRWFHADISNLWDGAVLVVLILAAVWPWFARLVSSEIGDRPGRGRGIAYTALAFYLLFECLRAVLHGRAVEQLSARMYGGEVPVSAAALPGPINPLRWTGIVETPDTFRRLDVNVNAPLETESASVMYKPATDRPIQMALSTEPFRYLRYFARFPAWSEQPVSLARGHGTRVDLTDLRFGAPGVGSFHSIALIDSTGRVLDSTFTFGSGAEIGYGGDEHP
jgi:inner membrane protein